MLTKDNNYRVMKLFFNSPEKKLHIREIARRTHLSPAGILKIVARLKKEGLLVSHNNGVVEEVSASKTSKFFTLKRCHNLLSLHDSGLIPHLLGHYEEPEAIVLFGSFARADDTSKSDIDIAVVTPKRTIPPLGKFESALGKKVNIYEISIPECSKEFRNGLANGAVLHGYLRLVQ